MASLTLYATHCTYEDRNGSPTHFPFGSLAKPIEAWLIIQRIGADSLTDQDARHIAHLIFGETSVLSGRFIVDDTVIEPDDLYCAIRQIAASKEFMSNVPMIRVEEPDDLDLVTVEVNTNNEDPKMFYLSKEAIRKTIDNDSFGCSIYSKPNGNDCAACVAQKRMDVSRFTKGMRIIEHTEVNKIEEVTVNDSEKSVKLSRWFETSEPYADPHDNETQESIFGMESRTINISHLRILLCDYSSEKDFRKIVGIHDGIHDEIHDVDTQYGDNPKEYFSAGSKYFSAGSKYFSEESERESGSLQGVIDGIRASIMHQPQ